MVSETFEVGGASDFGEPLDFDREQAIMRYRRRVMVRVSTVLSGVFGLAVIVIVANPVAGAGVAWLAPVVLVSLVMAIAGWLVVGHPFLLSPQYGRWLRTLKPFEPETFWGQSLQNLTRWVGGAGILVLGGVIGADLSSQPDVTRVMGQARELLGAVLVIGGVYVWWTGFLVKLATGHRRALKRGQLAVLRGTDASVWLLFVATWFAGVLATVVIIAGASILWPVVEKAWG